MLAPEVFARKHVAGGRATVILHDSRRFQTLEIGMRGWSVVSRMDGTRDVEGLVAALSHRIPAAEIMRFTDELEAAGVLAETSSPAKADESTAPAARASRPVEQLSGFRLRCDGRGSCCRFYPSIVFSPPETARARSLMPAVLDGAEDESNAFFPERGLERRSLAVALVDGHCAYLLGDGRCGIHAAGGASSKPFGCSLYPVSLVDDGTRVRATPVIECACVMESGVLPSEEGDELLERVSTTGDLDGRLVVDELPEDIVLADGKLASRAAVATWADTIARGEPKNIPAFLDALASEIEFGGLAREASPDALGRETFDATSLMPALERMRERALRRASEEFRAPTDLARQVFSLIEVAASMVLADLPAWTEPSMATHSSELFYLRAQLFGRQLIPRTPNETLAALLRERAARMLVARGMLVATQMAELTDPALRHPLAMLEAATRAYGLG